MRKLFLGLFLMLAFGWLAQVEAQNSQQVTLRVHQQRNVARNGLTIRFDSVLEDSRCPVDVNCVWAGNAKLQIRVGSYRRPTRIFTINTTTQPKTIVYAGYEIKVINLNPKMRTNIRINRNGYTATFEIRKV